MSKKKLLSEAQVRRFMGLAGINPLNETYNMSEEEDEMREMMHGDKKDDKALTEEEEMDMDAEEPAEMEAGDADVEMDEDDLADVKEALDTLQDKLGPLLDQAGGGEDMGMDADDDMDMGDEEPPPPPGDDMDADDDMDKVDEELMEVQMELTEDEIVNEVARRVAKRIVEAKRAHKKMNEALGRKTSRRRRK
jgi:tetrahydromethanopterin S-methyltransferase subunit G